MPHEGKYVYGIIATQEAPNFGPIGVGGNGDEVVTIGQNGLAVVVSNASRNNHYVVSREQLKAHTQVIEKVAESYSVLPMRFGTVAESTDEIMAFLEQNKRQLKNTLRDMEGKVEIGIKVLWSNMEQIFQELGQENKAIRALKKQGAKDQRALIRAGELVEAALEEKKAVEGEEYLRPLKKVAAGCKEAECTTEDMVVNTSLLVDRDWLKEFDATIDKISEEHKDRINIKYVGPTAPFSFVNLELQWNGGRA